MKNLYRQNKKYNPHTINKSNGSIIIFSTNNPLTNNDTRIADTIDEIIILPFQTDFCFFIMCLFYFSFQIKRLSSESQGSISNPHEMKKLSNESCVCIGIEEKLYALMGS